MIKSGALDGLGLNRREMMMNLPTVVSSLDAENRRNVDGQIDFFSLSQSPQASAAPELKTGPDYSIHERLQLEKEATGLYLSGHPMAQYAALSEKLHATRISDIAEADNDPMSRLHDGSVVKLLAIVTAVKKKTTKNDTTMAFVTVEDMYGSVELLVFPKIYAQYSHLLLPGTVLYLDGRLSLREDESAKVIPDRISTAPEESAVSAESGQRKAAPKPESDSEIPTDIQRGMFLLIDKLDSEQDKKVKNLLSIFDGNIPVYLCYNDTKQKYISNKGVDLNKPLISELKRLVGKKGVLFR